MSSLCSVEHSLKHGARFLGFEPCLGSLDQLLDLCLSVKHNKSTCS